RTFDRCGVHPFSVITAITYQTATEFYGYESLSDKLDKQLEAVLGDYPIKFVKIGMIPDSKTIDILIEYIKRYELSVVFDPVSVSSAGSRISSEGLELEIERDIFPLIKILTPNVNEAAYYSNLDLTNTTSDVIREAAEILLEKLLINENTNKVEKAVVLKSAASTQEKIFDIALINIQMGEETKKRFKIYSKNKISFQGNVHGTGCVFSSAITAFLAKGSSIEEAITKAEGFFASKFQNLIELPDSGKIIDLTLSNEQIEVINQIKEIYTFISHSQNSSKLIPEVRMNISCSLPNATKHDEIAGIEGRITIINGYPQASGEIKFGVSDHTARLILSVKKFDTSINLVLNLKYIPELIKSLRDKTDLEIVEIVREDQPINVKIKEFSTMEWLIKETVEKKGKIPDIIWDKGSVGKEPMIRLFGRNSKEIINKLKKILVLIPTKFDIFNKMKLDCTKIYLQIY
ncbi:hypothetical protein LCGC14_1772250, partial [marine sediment metagenome]